MNKSDVENIINKNSCIDDDLKKELISSMTSNLESILITPIIVDIYIYTYPSLNSIPSNYIELYKELFNILVKKHDKIKSFTRNSTSGLNDENLYDIFCFSSYLLAMNNKIEAQSEKDLQKLFSNCSVKLNLNDNNNSFRDIVDKTSLIIEDGRNYSYIHKSVLEYHAADFVKESPNDRKKISYEFFMRKLDPLHYNILSMLYVIDKEGFLNNIALNVYNEIYDKLELIKNNNFEINKDNVSFFSNIKDYTIRRIYAGSDIIEDNEVKYKKGDFIRNEIIPGDIYQNINRWFLELNLHIGWKYDVDEYEVNSVLDENGLLLGDNLFDEIIEKNLYLSKKENKIRTKSKCGMNEYLEIDYLIKIEDIWDIITKESKSFFKLKEILKFHYKLINDYKNEINDLNRKDENILDFIGHMI